MDDTKRGGSILQPILMFVGVFLFIAYGVGAMNTGNWLWFLPVQPDYEPTRVLVRDHGRSVEYRPGIDGFNELADALDLSLADFSNADLVPLGLSDETLMEYSESAVVVEAFYPQNIRFNTAVRMSNVNQLLIPVEGRHSGNRYVIMGSSGRWLAGALVMADDTPLTEALRALSHVE